MMKDASDAWWAYWCLGHLRYQPYQILELSLNMQNKKEEGSCMFARTLEIRNYFAMLFP